MTTAIIVLTQDKELSRLIGVRKTSLVPTNLRTRYPGLSIRSYAVNPSTTEQDICSYIDKISFSVTGVIVLCDNRLVKLISKLTTPFFTVSYDWKMGGRSVQNYFGMILSKTLRAFATFSTRFDQGGHQKLIVLPLRNFDASELRSLHLLFKNGVRPHAEFEDSLDKTLKALRARQRPKVETSSNASYTVDDRERYFIYGHEIHSQIETATPPHNVFCGVAGNYRFGKRYDRERHFNVSVTSGKIAGTFKNCHDESVERAPCSHLNMFPNDFFGAN